MVKIMEELNQFENSPNVLLLRRVNETITKLKTIKPKFNEVEVIDKRVYATESEILLSKIIEKYIIYLSDLNKRLNENLQNDPEIQLSVELELECIKLLLAIDTIFFNLDCDLEKQNAEQLLRKYLLYHNQSLKPR
jgi:hypothetical protein